MSNKKNNLHFSTKSIHVGNDTDETGSVVVPIHLTSTFRQPLFASTEKFVYSRVGSPTVKKLEENLAMLENADYAYAFSSGMAAMTAIFTMFKPNDHIIISKNVYGGVFRLVTQVLNNNGIDFEFIDTTGNSRSSVLVGEKHGKSNQEKYKTNSSRNAKQSIVRISRYQINCTNL